MPTAIPSSYHFSGLTSTNGAASGERYLIFFITGNPGLIAYYETFLSHLHALLSTLPAAQSGNASFDVCGRSLKGFETTEGKNELHGWADVSASQPGTHPPFGLQAQIEEIEGSVRKLVQEEIRSGREAPKVILMGHSVGSYILLEVLRRHRERMAAWKSNCDKIPDEGLRIVAGICLFPTVTHIGKSTSGRRLTPIFNLPLFAFVGSFLVKALFFFMPLAVLSRLVAAVTGFPSNAATTTAAFLKSPSGVHEALYMAKQEMATISSDAWDAEIWGAAHPTSSPFPRPKLFFLFGDNDHWVANETRDELIRARAGDEDWKPQMEVDEVEGWPHGFSIRHSIPVAERVKGYLEEVVQSLHDD